MKMLLLPKLDQQAVTGMRYDNLVKEMIVGHIRPVHRDFKLKIAICVDGKRNPQTGLDFHGKVIKDPANMEESPQFEASD